MKDLQLGTDTEKFTERFDHLLRFFSPYAKNVRLKKDEVIVFGTEEHQGVYLIVSGAVGFQVKGAGKSICRIKFGLGRVLGGMMLVNTQMRNPQEFLAECDTQLLFLNLEQYRQATLQFPEFSLLLLEESAREVQALQGVIKHSLRAN